MAALQRRVGYRGGYDERKLVRQMGRLELEGYPLSQKALRPRGWVHWLRNALACLTRQRGRRLFDGAAVVA